MTKSKQYEEGYAAYHEGLASIDNPYCILFERQKWQEWRSGFLDAFAEEGLKLTNVKGVANECRQ